MLVTATFPPCFAPVFSLSDPYLLFCIPAIQKVFHRLSPYARTVVLSACTVVLFTKQHYMHACTYYFISTSLDYLFFTGWQISAHHYESVPLEVMDVSSTSLETHTAHWSAMATSKLAGFLMEWEMICLEWLLRELKSHDSEVSPTCNSVVPYIKIWLLEDMYSLNKWRGWWVKSHRDSYQQSIRLRWLCCMCAGSKETWVRRKCCTLSAFPLPACSFVDAAMHR